MTDHSLTLGSLSLTDGLPDTEHDYSINVLADGASFGSADPVRAVVVSLLADGNLTRTTRYGNREVSFVVEITGPDLASVAHGEAALRRETGRSNVLVWQPPDGFAVPSAFEVVDSDMVAKFDDLDELRRCRKFTVTLTCSPWARSVDLVTVPAIAVGGTPTTVTVSTADSTSGWSTVAPATLGATGGYVSSTATRVVAGGEGEHYLFYAAATVPATPYVVVEWQSTFPTVSTPTLVAAPAVQTMNLTDGWQRTVYNTTGLSYSSLNFRALLTGTSGQFRIRDVKRTDTLPQISTRQGTRIAEVVGTERTPASLQVASADGTTDLGMTVVHTSPEDGSGYAPPLRRWRVSGAASPTTDSTMMSGVREPYTVANPFIAEVPNKALPEGGYLLAARARASSAGTYAINWSAETRIGGVGTGYITDFASITFPNTGWFFTPIAVLSLPTIRSAAGNIRISLSCSTGELDEAWLFRVDDDCALSVVHNALAARMWLDSPDVTSGVPRIWIGDAADRSDAFHPGDNLHTHGNHTFRPDAVRVFTATAVESPSVSLSYFPRWPHNAAS